jgi:hypothetical protein
LHVEQSETRGAHANIVPAGHALKFPKVSLYSGRTGVPPRWVEIHPQIDLLDEEIDAFDIGPVGPAFFMRHPHGQRGCFHEKLSHVVLQATAPEPGPARRAVSPVLDALAGGRDPLMARAAAPEDAVMTP